MGRYTVHEGMNIPEGVNKNIAMGVNFMKSGKNFVKVSLHENGVKEDFTIAAMNLFMAVEEEEVVRIFKANAIQC